MAWTTHVPVRRADRIGAERQDALLASRADGQNVPVCEGLNVSSVLVAPRWAFQFSLCLSERCTQLCVESTTDISVLDIHLFERERFPSYPKRVARNRGAVPVQSIAAPQRTPAAATVAPSAAVSSPPSLAGGACSATLRAVGVISVAVSCFASTARGSCAR